MELTGAPFRLLPWLIYKRGINVESAFRRTLAEAE